MSRQLARITIALLVLSACQRQQPTPTAPAAAAAPGPGCAAGAMPALLSLPQLYAQLDQALLRRLAASAQPASDGALGRNRSGYFHARFQMDVLPLTLYAITTAQPADLDTALRAISYAFAYQEPSGDFALQLPAALQNQQLSAGDRASGTAFFLAALGPALLALDDSPWYAQDADTAAARQQIEQLRPSFERALAFLKSQASVLQRADAAAPNRLLFDALALVSLGRYLNDQAAQLLGIDVMDRALALQDPAGFYAERGGYDSSYQAVALHVGLLLLPALTDTAAQQRLWRSLVCGSDWLATRIAPSGEIVTDGNTRVYPGGEQFLGVEKRVAYKDAALAFWHLYALTQAERYAAQAQHIAAFYTRR